jgi:hypothetical protein
MARNRLGFDPLRGSATCDKPLTTGLQPMATAAKNARCARPGSSWKNGSESSARFTLQDFSYPILITDHLSTR